MHQHEPYKVHVIVGTRPEAVKMAPVLKELRRRPTRFLAKLVSTGQHREMLYQTLSSFGLSPDIDLNIMTSEQTLGELTARVLTACEKVFKDDRPDLVLVQGDTTTVLSAALAAYYAKIPVGHVEAGLRSFDRYNPFPEEINRKMVSALATLHFAPTELSAAQLKGEGIEESHIFMTGNTVVDALKELRHTMANAVTPWVRASIEQSDEKLVLVTCHRRESFGKDLETILNAVRIIANQFPDRLFFFPVHLNPSVRTVVHARLSDVSNIHLCDPVSYADMLYALSKAELVLTDSGGLQEEAPSFGVPVVILRRTTERPEGIDAGFSSLSNIDENEIVSLAMRWLQTSRKKQLVGRPNPYGDGNAAARIVDSLEKVKWI